LTSRLHEKGRPEGLGDGLGGQGVLGSAQFPVGGGAREPLARLDCDEEPELEAEPMSKIRISALELQRRALMEVRKQPGCHNVQEVAINRVTAEHAANNWSLCVMSAGTTDANTAARGALHVQSILRRDYDF
jgi:hypothetical protein